MTGQDAPSLRSRELARVIVTGAIGWSDAATVRRLLDMASHRARAAGGSFRVLTGAAEGADRIAREWARATAGVELFAEPLEGEGAAHVRAYNLGLLALQPDLILAFKQDFASQWRHMQEPKGTEHMCRIAAEAGIPILLNGDRWLGESTQSVATGHHTSTGAAASIGGATLRRVQGDITGLTVDVIVNAANSSLLGGGGVDGAIHRAAGPALLEECRAVRARQGPCGTGEAVRTGAGDLAAVHVVHTVGPVWDPGDPERTDRLLARCYRESLDLAAGVRARSVALPCISTGVYRYPPGRAARVAAEAVAGWLSGRSSTVEEVLLVAFDEVNADAIDDAVAHLSDLGGP